MAARATRPAIPGREPPRQWRQPRRGSGRALAGRRLHAAHPDSVKKSVYEKLSYDLLRDIAPVAALFRAQYLMLVNPRSPAKTVPEFIAYVKANPGMINFGSNGVGATGHLAGELFKMMTGVNMLHVPYRGESPRSPISSPARCTWSSPA